MRLASILTYTAAGLALAACGGKHGGMTPDAAPADAPAIDAPAGGGDGAMPDAAATFGLTAISPGAALAELLFQYGTLDHVATGDANTGALSLSLGYRFRF